MAPCTTDTIEFTSRNPHNARRFCSNIQPIFILTFCKLGNKVFKNQKVDLVLGLQIIQLIPFYRLKQIYRTPRCICSTWTTFESLNHLSWGDNQRRRHTPCRLAHFLSDMTNPFGFDNAKNRKTADVQWRKGRSELTHSRMTHDPHTGNLTLHCPPFSFRPPFLLGFRREMGMGKCNPSKRWRASFYPREDGNGFRGPGALGRRSCSLVAGRLDQTGAGMAVRCRNMGNGRGFRHAGHGRFQVLRIFQTGQRHPLCEERHSDLFSPVCTFVNHGNLAVIKYTLENDFQLGVQVIIVVILPE